MIIPLFPLQSVLFPGGRLPLRIFEQRYMDMAKVCLKESTSFGICLIAEGEEVARAGEKPAAPSARCLTVVAAVCRWTTSRSTSRWTPPAAAARKTAWARTLAAA